MKDISDFGGGYVDVGDGRTNALESDLLFAPELAHATFDLYDGTDVDVFETDLETFVRGA